MKKLLSLLMVWSLNTYAQSGDGPFGFDIGSDVSSYKNCSKSNDTGMYECNSAKKPHPDMESYIIQHFDGIGICWVKGIGKTISDNGSGLSTKAQTDKIKSQIENVYGKSTRTFDFLTSGSIWDDFNDWMMGVAKRERYYRHYWNTDDGYQQVKRIKGIAVVAQALASDKGYVVVEFAGDNEDLCEEAANARGEDAF